MIRVGLVLLLWLVASVAPAAVPEAQALWDNGSYRQAFAAASEAAFRGDPQAQYLLGEAYRLGRSVDADQFQARDWYMRAARQGDVASAAALGELLVQMRQSRDAVQWLTLAASHNHARATALLAAIYYTGDGAEPDLILATSLMKKAAALGSPEARAKLAWMDDTAPPVDVSSPLPSAEPASREIESRIQVASALSAPRIERDLHAAQPTRRVGAGRVVRIQVGAFRSAGNARRALTLFASRIVGGPSSVAIIRSRGFYKLLLIADGRQSARIAQARLVEIGWQHFVRPRRMARA